MLLLIPQLGLIKLATGELLQAGRAARDRNRRIHGERAIDSDSGEEAFAADFAEQILRTALPSLSVVVFVEDLHLADSTLIEVLARLLTTDAGAVLVITSCGWTRDVDEWSSRFVELSQCTITPK